MPEKNAAEKIAEELLKERKNGEEKVSITPPPIKKAAKNSVAPLIKSKHYYDIKVECTLPATLTFRVLAEDPVQAAALIKGMSPTGVKHRLFGRKDHKLTVYESGSSMIKWVKNLIGV